ncbi:MAG: 3-keto-disaccharide hydrolase, partial [Verrucomicrobiales bacterium]
MLKKSLLLLACLLPLSFATAEDESGFTDITPDEKMTGWKIVGGNGQYKVENGEVIGFGENIKGNTFLISEKNYGDFDFRFEMKFDTLAGNSGMMFRAAQKESEKGNGRVFGYQCEHDNGLKRSWTAGLFDEARRGWLFPSKADKEQSKAFTEQGQKIFKSDDWNEIRILAEGNHIQIWLNGEKRVDFKDTDEKNTDLEGFFGMQVHGGKKCDVRWRKLR